MAQTTRTHFMLTDPSFGKAWSGGMLLLRQKLSQCRQRTEAADDVAMRLPQTGLGYGATKQRENLGQENSAGCPTPSQRIRPVVTPHTDGAANAPVLIGTSILDSNLKVAEKMLLIHLFRFSGWEGRAWPSEKKLAAKTRTSPRTVRQHLKGLERRSLILRRRRRGSSNLFILPTATSLNA